MDSTIKDAQCFVASTVHRQLTNPSPTSHFPLPESVPVANKKTAVKKNIGSAAAPQQDYPEVTWGDNDNTTTR
jgi:hypothetical protein